VAAFAPDLLRRPLLNGGVMTRAFAAGFAIIALGICLTGFYAFSANRRDDRKNESK
jgi:uncharacterized membrane protein (DUF485 family)